MCLWSRTWHQDGQKAPCPPAKFYAYCLTITVESCYNRNQPNINIHYAYSLLIGIDPLERQDCDHIIH